MLSAVAMFLIATVSGGEHLPYRTSRGLAIHESCFEYADRAHLDRKTVERAVSRIVERAYELVTSRCANRHPELMPYLRAWVSQFRRARLTCAVSLNSDSSVAKNLVSWFSMMDTLRPNQRAGIELNVFESAPASRKSIIAIRESAFLELVEAKTEAETDKFAELLIHEVLHSTGANVHGALKHNSVAREFAAAGGVLASGCQNDISEDRVYLVTSLCTGGWIGQSGTAEDILSRRMASCGPRKGCEDIFRDTTFFETTFTPSKPLAPRDAESLCSRVSELGACRAKLYKRSDLSLEYLKNLDIEACRADTGKPEENPVPVQGLNGVKAVY